MSEIRLSFLKNSSMTVAKTISVLFEYDQSIHCDYITGAACVKSQSIQKDEFILPLGILNFIAVNPEVELKIVLLSNSYKVAREEQEETCLPVLRNKRIEDITENLLINEG